MQDPKKLIRSVAGYVPPEARSAASRALRRVEGLRTTTNEPYQLWRSRLADDLAVSVDQGVAFAGCGLQARNIAGALSAAGGRVVGAYDARPEAAERFLTDFARTDNGDGPPAPSPCGEPRIGPAESQ